MSKTLYSYQSPNHPKKWLTLEEAIQNFKTNLEGAIALLYSPTKCHILQFKNGQFQDYYGIIIKDISKCFEAKIFTPTLELRWLNSKKSLGQAVLLSEDPIPKPDNFTETTIDYQESIKQQYLLWGEIISWDKVAARNKNFQKGWQRLTEARIDKIDVPFNGELGKNKRIYLQTVEYIAEKNYGNMVVIEERLVKLHSSKTNP